TGFVVHEDHITASNNVKLVLENGLSQTTVNSFAYHISVLENIVNGNPDINPNPQDVINHFRQGAIPPVATLPTGVFGGGSTAVAVDYDYGVAPDSDKGLIAKNGNIVVVGPTSISGPFVNVTGFTDIQGSGHIDVLT